MGEAWRTDATRHLKPSELSLLLSDLRRPISPSMRSASALGDCFVYAKLGSLASAALAQPPSIHARRAARSWDPLLVLESGPSSNNSRAGFVFLTSSMHLWRDLLSRRELDVHRRRVATFPA